MAKNVTIKMDEALLKLCRHEAVENDKSLSQWIAEVVKEALKKKTIFENTKKHALQLIEQGFDLGGKPLDRDQIYDR
jgi:hypothetical protein